MSVEYDVRRSVPAWIHVGGQVVHCTLERKRTVCGRELGAGQAASPDQVFHPNKCRRCEAKLVRRGWFTMHGHKRAHFWLVDEGRALCGQESFLDGHFLAAELTLQARIEREAGGHLTIGHCVKCLRREVPA